MRENSSMTFDPGRVRLTLTMDEGVVSRAGAACERPDVARLLRGQPAEQAVALVPLIYSLCGKAQGIAARVALDAARGDPVETHVDADVLAEAAREHAWKLFIDWPRQLGLDPDEAFFVRLLRAKPDQRNEMAALLAIHPLLTKLREVIGAGGLAELLAARMAVRRQELQDWLLDVSGTLGGVGSMVIAPRIGEACVETARGLLTHRLALTGDHIADYTIKAPTDTHFSAGGDVEKRLEQLRGMSQAQAEQQALRLVMAFDPCVPWCCEFS